MQCETRSLSVNAIRQNSWWQTWEKKYFVFFCKSEFFYLIICWLEVCVNVAVSPEASCKWNWWKKHQWWALAGAQLEGYNFCLPLPWWEAADLSAEAEQSLIRAVFFLSGCPNPNSTTIFAEQKWAASDECIFFFPEFSLLIVVISIGTQFRCGLQVQALRFTAFMSGECNHYFFL